MEWEHQIDGMDRGAAVVHGTINLHHWSRIADHWIEKIGKKHSECPQKSSWSTICWLLPGEKREITPQINRLARIVLSGHGWKYFSQKPHEHIALVQYGNYMYMHMYLIALGGDSGRTGVELLYIPSLMRSTVMNLPRPLSSITAICSVPWWPYCYGWPGLYMHYWCVLLCWSQRFTMEEPWTNHDQNNPTPMFRAMANA